MLSATVEDIKKIGRIREQLLSCSDAMAVDAVFAQFNIGDFGVKTILLRHSMQVQEVYDAPVSLDDPPASAEAVYLEELEFFLDGQWRDLV